MAAVESEFYPPAAELVVIIAESFNQMAGPCSHHVLFHHVVLRMTAGPKSTLQVLRFCVSLIVVMYF